MEQTKLVDPPRRIEPQIMPDKAIRALGKMIDEYGLSGVLLGISEACRAKCAFVQDPDIEAEWRTYSYLAKGWSESIQIVGRHTPRSKVVANGR